MHWEILLALECDSMYWMYFSGAHSCASLGSVFLRDDMLHEVQHCNASMDNMH